MSRIGKKPILIPNGVTVSIDKSVVKIKGVKGELSLVLRPEIGVKMENDKLETFVKVESKATPAYWGMTRSLLSNMVQGVVEGFEKKLELVGVGYRAKQNGKGVTLAVGFSHPVEFAAPEGIEITVPDTTNITIKGIDKHLVGLIAAQIRAVKKPEPYKGKGIKYAGEIVRRKAGKAGKV